MVQVQNRQRAVKVPTARLRALAERIVDELGVADRPASLVLVTDRAIRRLNRDFRGKDQPTNVLAFAEAEDADAALFEPALGDVVVSVETARREAAELAGTSPEAVGEAALVDRLLWLMVHGFLHLVGFDHRDDAEEARMEESAETLLASIRTAIGVDLDLRSGSDGVSNRLGR
jgi:probable rRNA maturation factor